MWFFLHSTCGSKGIFLHPKFWWYCQPQNLSSVMNHSRNWWNTREILFLPALTGSLPILLWCYFSWMSQIFRHVWRNWRSAKLLTICNSQFFTWYCKSWSFRRVFCNNHKTLCSKSILTTIDILGRSGPFFDFGRFWIPYRRKKRKVQNTWQEEVHVFHKIVQTQDPCFR